MLPMINFISFNQTGSCISVGTSEGFKIFNCDPFGKFYSDEEGGCGIVEMLFSTSLLAVVGIGDNPSMSPRRLKIINTKRHSVICEVTFPTTILAVKMNKSRLIVLLHDQVYIYDITSMRLLHTIETSNNPHGLVTMSASPEHNYLAYPSPPKIINSEIREYTTNNMKITNQDSYLQTDPIEGDNEIPPLSVKNSTPPMSTDSNSLVKNGDVILFNLQTLQPVMVIEAHKGEIAALALSRDGSLLATASEKGTIIRVFSVNTGIKIYQFRRGTYPTKIYSLNFSDDNQFLVASSSNKTVHVFKLGGMNSTGFTEKLDITSGEEDSLDDDLECLSRNEPGNDDVISASSIESGKVNVDDSLAREPIVDSSRRTVGRMLRKSSQKLSRKAAKALGAYFPTKVTSILEPSRHFASLKIPLEANSGVKSIASIGESISINTSQYPELLVNSFPEGPSLNIVKMIPIRVVSSEGFIYNYLLDPDRGGDCLLLSQYPLLND